MMSPTAISVASSISDFGLAGTGVAIGDRLSVGCVLVFGVWILQPAIESMAISESNRRKFMIFESDLSAYMVS
jgi:hypothetical protein